MCDTRNYVEGLGRVLRQGGLVLGELYCVHERYLSANLVIIRLQNTSNPPHNYVDGALTTDKPIVTFSSHRASHVAGRRRAHLTPELNRLTIFPALLDHAKRLV